MTQSLHVVVAMVLAGVATLSSAGPPGRYGGHYGAHVRPPGAYPVGAYRPYYPGYRPFYPGWRVGYWGSGVVVGAAWPYAWGAPYAVPYVVTTVPAPQVIVQPAAPAETPASYWYYCRQPAGYHPYVERCDQPWLKVVPQVPGSGTAPQLAP